MRWNMAADWVAVVGRNYYLSVMIYNGFTDFQMII
jgi:hypothetical protein